MIRGETAGGEHAVDVRMMLQSLVPGVQHAEEANLGTEMPGSWAISSEVSALA